MPRHTDRGIYSPQGSDQVATADDVWQTATTTDQAIKDSEALVRGELGELFTDVPERTSDWGDEVFNVVFSDDRASWLGVRKDGAPSDHATDEVARRLGERGHLGGGVVATDYTGTRDASGDINAAIQARAPYGAPVRLGPGVLRLEREIYPVSGLVFEGAGPGRTILRPQGQVPAFRNTDTHTGPNTPTLDDVVFRGFEIDGSDQWVDEYRVHVKGLYITGLRRVLLDNLYVHDTIATGIGIDHISGVIRSCTVRNCGRGNDGTMLGGAGIGIGVGDLDPDWEPLTIIGCHAYDCGHYGIFIESQTGPTPSGISFIGNTARGNYIGMADTGGGGTIIAHNHIFDSVTAGIQLARGSVFHSGPGKHSLIQGNHIHGNETGIVLEVDRDKILDGIVVDGNTIHDNTAAGVLLDITVAGNMVASQRVRVSGNDIWGNGSDGVRVIQANPESTSTPRPIRRTSITRNRIWENVGTGIYFTYPSVGTAIVGNEVWDDQDPQIQGGAVRLIRGPHTDWTVESNVTTDLVAKPTP